MSILLVLPLVFAFLIFFGLFLIIDSHRSDPRRPGAYAREFVLARREYEYEIIRRKVYPPRNRYN